MTNSADIWMLQRTFAN